MFRMKFEVRTNADTLCRFKWVDAAGQAIDLTGATLALHVKKSVDDSTPALSLTTQNGLIQHETSSSGTFLLHFPKNSLRAGQYYFDLVRTDPDQIRTTISFGEINVVKGVTSP